ncbi:MAG: hypothetical protein K2P78_14505 [Gemmataceae bacterium]|nr:hypothetical protein [Gemmataceae bacterium]
MPRTAPPKGFTCPNCACKAKTIKTVRRANGVVSRRRECPQCGKRFSTEERIKCQK